MKKNNVLTIKNAIITIIVAVVGYMIWGYLSAPSPILFIQAPCPQVLNLNSENKYSIILQNRTETEVFSQLCLETTSVLIKDNNKTSYCWSKGKVPLKSADLQSIYETGFIVANPESATINVSTSCDQIIASFLHKKCDSLNLVCQYKKGTTFGIGLELQK